jgi:hypothetical protein
MKSSRNVLRVCIVTLVVISGVAVAKLRAATDNKSIRPFHFNPSKEALEVFEGLSCKSRMTVHTARGQTQSHYARMMPSFMKDKATETKTNI